MKPVSVAMIGVGAISGIYLKNIFERFPEIRLAGVCDLIPERAEKARETYPSLTVYKTMFDAFRDPEVEVILNLTRPYQHFDVSMAALRAGKHVYSEKPLGASFAEGQALAREAEARGLYLGGAPDTFLGAGIQTCRAAIDAGEIGEVIGASAHMIGHGPESWHPDPEFFYRYGGGPMMDMGPYYITALVNLMGRVKETVSFSRASFPVRVATCREHMGEEIPVEVPTYVDGLLRFESGAIGRMFATFDVYYPQAAGLEIYGSRGTLFVPDPNTFSGPVTLINEKAERIELPVDFGFDSNSRALGLWDMCASIRQGAARPRAGYMQTLHVLEVLTSLAEGSGQTVTMSTPFERQKPMTRDAEKTGRIL